MRILVAAVVGALALFAVEARAQTPPAYSTEQLALAQEIVELSGAEGMLGQMMETLAPQLANQLIATGASREVATRYVEIFLEEFRADMPRIIGLTSVSYATAFTEDELRD